MIVLGIETSCDETAVAIYDGNSTLSHQLFSQIDIHKDYGGVVPELASRNHMAKLPILLEEALKEANITLHQLDIIAYTRAPGLLGALMVGANFANTLARLLGKPTIGIHHMEAHLLCPLMGIDNISFPFISLLVSGGHTQIILVRGYGDYLVLGTTIDDAVGEAFDKSATLLGLGYPGGAEISRLAKLGQPIYKLPFALAKSDDFNFSFSGLKTHIKNLIFSLEKDGSLEKETPNICASVQQTIVKTLMSKTISAMDTHDIRTLVISGGVSANQYLRDFCTLKSHLSGKTIFFAPQHLSTDNAIMVAFAGYLRARAGKIDKNTLEPSSRWDIETLERF